MSDQKSRESGPDAPRHNAKGQLLCNATSKQTGKPCGAIANRGKTKCRFHGGATPRGPAHGAWKHGRRSKYLPANLRDKYESAMSDPDLMSYREDVAILESRAASLLESMESQALWEKAQAAFQKLNAAIHNKEGAAITTSLNDLSGLLQRGREDAARWADYYKVTDMAGRAKEREYRRLVDMQQMLTLEQFMSFVRHIVDVAAQTITDRDSLRAFTKALDGAWNQGGQEPPRTSH